MSMSRNGSFPSRSISEVKKTIRVRNITSNKFLYFIYKYVCYILWYETSLFISNKYILFETVLLMALLKTLCWALICILLIYFILLHDKNV